MTETSEGRLNMPQASLSCPHCQGSIILDLPQLAVRLRANEHLDDYTAERIFAGVVSAGDPPPITELTEVFEENPEKGGTEPMQTEKPEGQSDQPPQPAEPGNVEPQTEQPAAEPQPAAQEEPPKAG
jgi:hypothetical protein